MATTIAPAVRFIENRPGSIDINYYMHRTIECLNEVCSKQEYTPSRIFKGPANHRYFYIYFYMPIEKIRTVLNAIAVTFQKSMRNKVVVITYLNGAYTETLIAPQLPKPPIRTIAAPSFSTVPKKPSPRAAAGYKDIKTPSGVSGQKSNSTTNKYSIPTNAEVISKYLLSDLLQISSYDYLLGKGNLPDKLLVKLIKGMREESRKKEFKKTILSPELLTPIDIDGSPFDFAINIKLEEAVQNGGSSLSSHCSFKQETAHLLVDAKQQEIMLLSENRKRSSLLFAYNTSDWMSIAYFLYSFYSSDCRFKRSVLPFPTLRKLGVYRIGRAYRAYTENCFIRGQWFPIQNKRNQIQKRFQIEAINYIS